MFLASLLLTGVTITLPAEAAVSGAEFALGDVAAIESDDGVADAELVLRLRALPMGYAPAPGYSRVLRADRIAFELRADVLAGRVRLAGAALCRVVPETEAIASASLLEAARTELQRALGADPAVELRLTPLDTPSPLEVPRGQEAARLVARVEELRTHGSEATLPVRVEVDGAPHRTVTTRWTVERWTTCEVPVQGIAPGTTLFAAQFEQRRVHLGVEERPLSLARLVGTVTKVELSAGRAVGEAEVERPRVVESGSVLLLIVRSGGLVVSTRVEALEPGAVGDQVRVRAVGRDKELVARITGPGRALIEF